MFKGKKFSTFKNFDFPNNQNRIQCRECDCFRHIQSEYTNTRKKKNKALKLTWNDEEFDGSQEEDNLVSQQIAFSGTFVLGNNLFMHGGSCSVATDTVTKDSKSETSSLCESDSNCGDEFEKDIESL